MESLKNAFGIARDLHDSVGHRIAVVSMHLGAAEVHLPLDAVEARTDLDQARLGVQAVLQETQQILRVLRVGEMADSLDPTPDYDLIPGLIESYRTAGLEIETTLPAITQPLPQETRAAVFRIIQESLTNAQKYGTGTVSLTVEGTDDDRLVIDVVNMHNHSVSSSARGGNGLVGMRERAASAGGTLEVTVNDTLHWVRAELPIQNGTNT